MHIADFDYDLPPELIAQQPLAERDTARMLVLDRRRASWCDDGGGGRFADLPSHLTAGDTLVVNNTRVFPARLIGRREPQGGQVELLLVAERASSIWEALTRPARRLPRGARLSFGGSAGADKGGSSNSSDSNRFYAEVVEVLPDGRRLLRFEYESDFDQLLDAVGRTPLPPYIKRDATTALTIDHERYQTVYARKRGAIAAPTAGLHFTPTIIESLRRRGVHIVEVTLHVGYGTFAPVRAENLREHKVAPEYCEISPEAAQQINEAQRRADTRIIAVGTTTVRALEAAVDNQGIVQAGERLTDLTITPGHSFQVVDALITNFHLPRSSLLILVAAFAGRDLTLAAYRYAVEARYRFYSYGDCMLIT